MRIKNLTAFLIMSALAIAFGYWFARHQLSAIDSNAIATYPKAFFYLTILKVYTTLIAFYVITDFVLAKITDDKINPNIIAFIFLPILLVYASVSLLWIAASMAALATLAVISVLSTADYDYLIKKYGIDASVFALFFVLHFFLSTRFSPLSFDVVLLAGKGYYTEELPVLAPIFRGFVWAKQFAFSYVDHSEWAGIMNPPITLASPFLQLITFIFDLPSISVVHFHQVLMFVHFTLLVLGSFGFYLFLKYAAKLQTLFACFGGYLFFFSGAPLLGQMFLKDGGVFLSSYAVFPFALLFLVRAFEKNNLYPAAFSGLALAAQFFFYTPHPEAVIYSLLFLMIFAVACCVFQHQCSVHRRIMIVATTLASFLILSAYTILPILMDRITGNMFVFAHTGDISHVSLSGFKNYLIIFLVATIFSFRQLQQAENYFVYASSLALSGFLILFILITSNPSVLTFLVNTFHIGLHFWYPWRIGMYFCMCVFIIAMFALQAITLFIWQFVTRQGKHALEPET